MEEIHFSISTQPSELDEERQVQEHPKQRKDGG